MADADTQAEQGGAGGVSRWIAAAVVAAAVIALFLSGDGVPEPLEPGSLAPDFTLARHGASTPASLSGHMGQVVLVNFWATWCKPCEDEMPAMERLYQALHPEGFEMLAISVDQEGERVGPFLERMQVTFPILLDPDQAVSRLYQTTGFPESLLVDRDGRLVERYVGPRDWDAPIFVERIRDLLAR
jgi:peroxiredoxin